MKTNEDYGKELSFLDELINRDDISDSERDKIWKASKVKITDEEIEYIINTLGFEIECWKNYGGYVEYDVSRESYEMSKGILEKLRKFVGGGEGK